MGIILKQSINIPYECTIRGDDICTRDRRRKVSVKKKRIEMNIEKFTGRK